MKFILLYLLLFLSLFSFSQIDFRNKRLFSSSYKQTYNYDSLKNISFWKNMNSLWDVYPQQYKEKYFEINRWKLIVNCKQKTTELNVRGDKLTEQAKQSLFNETDCAKYITIIAIVFIPKAERIVELKQETIEISR